MYKISIKLFLHFIIWTGIFIIITLMPLRPDEPFSLSRNYPFIITFLFLVCFFYINANYLSVKYLFNKKYSIYIISIILVLLLYIYLHHHIIVLFAHSRYSVPPQFPIKAPPGLPNMEMERVISMRRVMLPLIQFFLFWILSLCYRLALEWISANKRNKEIETEKSIIELSYLKAQINPHFLFNTLNTIYSLTLNGNKKATDAILLYSQITRYVLDKIDTNLVPLEEEIEYISNYIDLQVLRFTDSLNIEFDVRGDIKDHEIAPLIFISFIENAFQYGISNHYSSTIFISIEATDDHIRFISKNNKYKKDEFQHIGKNTGIKNTQRKLNLIYPNEHKLHIEDTENSFFVDLLIYNKRIINN